MDEFLVSTPAQAAAAVLAASRNGKAAAARNPFAIKVLDTSLRYVFNAGVTGKRARHLAERFRQLPAGAFE